MDKLVRWSSIFYLKLCQTCQLKYPQFCLKHPIALKRIDCCNYVQKISIFIFIYLFQARFSNPSSMVSTHSSIPRNFGIPLHNSEISSSNNNKGDNSSRNSSSQVSPPNSNNYNNRHNNPNNSGARNRHSTSRTFETIQHSNRTSSSHASHRYRLCFHNEDLSGFRAYTN